MNIPLLAFVALSVGVWQGDGHNPRSVVVSVGTQRALSWTCTMGVPAPLGLALLDQTPIPGATPAVPDIARSLVFADQIDKRRMAQDAAYGVWARLYSIKKLLDRKLSVREALTVYFAGPDSMALGMSIDTRERLEHVVNAIQQRMQSAPYSKAQCEERS